MQYKVRYRPLEKLTRDGWQRMDGDEHSRLIAEATAPRDSKSAATSDGLSKDGQTAPFKASKTI